MKYWSNSKITIPKLGFGTYCLKAESAVSTIKYALELGLTHIDTAVIYNNETEVGRAIKESTVSRKEIFLTTKIWRDSLTEKKIKSSFKEILNRLKVDYVDMLLIHWPNPEVSLAESLGALMQLQTDKKILHIGVSNFNKDLLSQAKQICPQIVTNQIEYHPLLSQKILLDFIENQNLFLTAYSPLIRGKAHQIQQLITIGKYYNKTSSQIALKWLIDQKNVVVIFKSAKKEHIKENFNLFDFELQKKHKDQLFRLNKNKYRVIDPPFSPKWDD